METVFMSKTQTLHTETGPNLNKKCVCVSDASPSHEILRKINFIVKPLKKV